MRPSRAHPYVPVRPVPQPQQASGPFRSAVQIQARERRTVGLAASSDFSPGAPSIPGYENWRWIRVEPTRRPRHRNVPEGIDDHYRAAQPSGPETRDTSGQGAGRLMSEACTAGTLVPLPPPLVPLPPPPKLEGSLFPEPLPPLERVVPPQSTGPRLQHEEAVARHDDKSQDPCLPQVPDIRRPSVLPPLNQLEATLMRESLPWAPPQIGGQCENAEEFKLVAVVGRQRYMDQQLTELESRRRAGRSSYA